MRTQDHHLRPDAFEEVEQQQVFAALCQNFSEGIPHNRVELMMRLKENAPESCGQTEAWLSLAEAEVDDISAAEKWMEHVIEAWTERRKKVAFEEVVGMAAEGAELSEIVTYLSDKFAEIEDSNTLDEQRIERQRKQVAEQNERRIRGQAGLVTTGIDFIDHECGKIRSHEYIVIGARPAVGKSAFARALMMGMVKTTKKPVMLFSLEMPLDEVILHLASTNCDVSVRNVEDDFEANQDKLIAEQQRFTEALGKFLLIRDDLTEIRDIEHAINVAMRRYKPGLVIIDYLQLVSAAHLKVNREREVAHISRRLKLLANMHRVPMIVLSQLNRLSEQEDREPKLSDLRESGGR